MVQAPLQNLGSHKFGGQNGRDPSSVISWATDVMLYSGESMIHIVCKSIGIFLLFGEISFENMILKHVCWELRKRWNELSFSSAEHWFQNANRGHSFWNYHVSNRYLKIHLSPYLVLQIWGFWIIFTEAIFDWPGRISSFFFYFYRKCRIWIISKGEKRSKKRQSLLP